MNDNNINEVESIVEEEERSIPSVSEGRANSGPILMAGGLVFIVLVLGGYALMSGGETEAQQVKLTDVQDDDEFSQSHIENITIPEVVELEPISVPDFGIGLDPLKVEKKPEPEQKVIIKTVEVPTQLTPEQQQILLNAAKLIERNNQLMQRRQRASGVVFNSLDKPTEFNSQDKNLPGLYSDAEKRKQNLLSALSEQVTGFSSNVGGASAAQPKSALQAQLGAVSEFTAVNAGYIEDQDWKVLQGSIITAVLETAIQSDQPSFIKAHVDADVYSSDGKNLLVRRGSKLIGETGGVIQQGQVRIFTIWNRLITPEGVDVALGSPGVGPLGRGGFGGWVDNHFVERFGGAVLLSVIGAITTSESDDAFAESTADNLNEQSTSALDSTVNIAPTFHKNQGDRVNVFVAKDLNFKGVSDKLVGRRVADYR
ncbi:MAG: hypothetical protein HN790_05460 [Methylococcales bacterium]|jgi:type IV secretion system protein VirB10|nr:hypothetical protein [Methylococcales bacterium]